MVANQRQLERNAGDFRITLGRVHTTVGDRHDNVGIDWGLGAQESAHLLPRPHHRLAVEHAVGAREVDVLEYAVPRLRSRRPRRVRNIAGCCPPGARRDDIDHLVLGSHFLR